MPLDTLTELHLDCEEGDALGPPLLLTLCRERHSSYGSPQALGRMAHGLSLPLDSM